ncbi:MAG: hypothetical protein QOD07_545 [Frankiaceae bacterium]|jgi:hypothetical protein|nr:hypothetical protein [Frankiaceae bacterium]
MRSEKLLGLSIQKGRSLLNGVPLYRTFGTCNPADAPTARDTRCHNGAVGRADDRDRAASGRDRAARRRDDDAEARDVAAAGREAEGDFTGTAADREAAAHDRMQAAIDREMAARDRDTGDER